MVRGLVEQQQVGLAGERARERGARQLAAGEGLEAAVEVGVREAEAAEDACSVVAPAVAARVLEPRLRLAVAAQRLGRVVAARHRLLEPAELLLGADEVGGAGEGVLAQGVTAEPRRPLVVERDARALLPGELAALQLDLADERAQQRRLPGAVRAGEREPVAPLDLERDAVEERVAGELLAETGCDQHCHALQGNARARPGHRHVVGAGARLRRARRGASPADRSATRDARPLRPAGRVRRRRAASRSPREAMDEAREEAGGEVDAVAISCFWHSLVGVDSRRPPGHAGADLAAARARRRAAARLRRGPRAHRLPAAPELLADEDRRPARAGDSARPLPLVLGSPDRAAARASRWRAAPACSASTAAGTRSCSRRSGSTRSSCPSSPTSSCSATARRPTSALARSGRTRAALTIGTSAALRTVHERSDAARPGLFLYRVDGSASSRVARSPTAATCSTGSSACFGRRRDGRARRRSAGRARLPGSARRRAQPRLARARTRRRLRARRSTSERRDVVRAALEGVAHRFAEIAALMPELEEIVGSGGALLQQPGLGADPRRRARAAR